MSKETESIFNSLSETYNGPQKLKTIFHSFKSCSIDKNNFRSLVDSEIKCINFDKLTKWIHGSCLPQSADSMTFSGKYVYFIEFKTGDQVEHERKREKLINGVIGKINDSDDTLFSDICSKIEGLNTVSVRLRFYLVVDAKEMGISSLVSTLAALSTGPSTLSDPKIAQLIQTVLPNLKEGTNHPEHFDQIDIWYSDLFERYLIAHKIRDIDSLFGNE